MPVFQLPVQSVLGRVVLVPIERVIQRVRRFLGISIVHDFLMRWRTWGRHFEKQSRPARQSLRWGKVQVTADALELTFMTKRMFGRYNCFAASFSDPYQIRTGSGIVATSKELGYGDCNPRKIGHSCGNVDHPVNAPV